MWEQNYESSYSINDFEKGADLFLEMMIRALEPAEALHVLTALVSKFIEHAADDKTKAVETFASEILKKMAFMSITVEGNETQH